jgi:hypothetical protein
VEIWLLKYSVILQNLSTSISTQRGRQAFARNLVDLLTQLQFPRIVFASSCHSSRRVDSQLAGYDSDMRMLKMFTRMVGHFESRFGHCSVVHHHFGYDCIFQRRPQFRYFVSKTDSDLFALAQQLRFPALEMIAVEDQPAVRTAANVAMSAAGQSLICQACVFEKELPCFFLFTAFILFDASIISAHCYFFVVILGPVGARPTFSSSDYDDVDLDMEYPDAALQRIQLPTDPSPHPDVVPGSHVLRLVYALVSDGNQSLYFAKIATQR